nr:hypothetical protein [uncultured Agathobaculum sp.]
MYRNTRRLVLVKLYYKVPLDLLGHAVPELTFLCILLHFVDKWHLYIDALFSALDMMYCSEFLY